MAYVSKEMKAKTAPVINALLKQYGLKGSLSVNNHSTLVLTVRQGSVDFIGNYNKENGSKPRHVNTPFQPATTSLSVNPYWAHEHFSGKAKEFIVKAIAALKGPDFFDDSDSMTDYFHCSHYVDINIGKWDKPYALVK